MSNFLTSKLFGLSGSLTGGLSSFSLPGEITTPKIGVGSNVDPFQYTQQIGEGGTVQTPDPFQYTSQIGEGGDVGSVDPLQYSQQIGEGGQVQAPDPFQYAQQVSQQDIYFDSTRGDAQAGGQAPEIAPITEFQPVRGAGSLEEGVQSNLNAQLGVANQFGQQSDAALLGLRQSLSEQTNRIMQATDAATLTEPLREGFEKAQSSIEEVRLAETRIATEELRAFEQASNDPRLAATARVKRQRFNDVINSIAGVAAQTTAQFGEQMTNALMQAGQLTTQGAATIMQGAQGLAALTAESLGIQSQLAASAYNTNTQALISMADLEFRHLESLRRYEIDRSGQDIQRDQLDISRSQVDIQRGQMEIDRGRLGVELGQLALAEGEFGLDQERYALEREGMQADQAYKMGQLEIQRGQFDLQREQFYFDQDVQQSRLGIEMGQLALAQAEVAQNQERIDLERQVQRARTGIDMAQVEIQRGQLDLARQQAASQEAYQQGQLALQAGSLGVDQGELYLEALRTEDALNGATTSTTTPRIGSSMKSGSVSSLLSPSTNAFLSSAREQADYAHKASIFNNAVSYSPRTF